MNPNAAQQTTQAKIATPSADYVKQIFAVALGLVPGATATPVQVNQHGHPAWLFEPTYGTGGERYFITEPAVRMQGPSLISTVLTGLATGSVNGYRQTNDYLGYALVFDPTGTLDPATQVTAFDSGDDEIANVAMSALAIAAAPSVGLYMAVATMQLAAGLIASETENTDSTASLLAMSAVSDILVAQTAIAIRTAYYHPNDLAGATAHLKALAAPTAAYTAAVKGWPVAGGWPDRHGYGFDQSSGSTRVIMWLPSVQVVDENTVTAAIKFDRVLDNYDDHVVVGLTLDTKAGTVAEVNAAVNFQSQTWFDVSQVATGAAPDAMADWSVAFVAKCTTYSADKGKAAAIIASLVQKFAKLLLGVEPKA